MIRRGAEYRSQPYTLVVKVGLIVTLSVVILVSGCAVFVYVGHRCCGPEGGLPYRSESAVSTFRTEALASVCDRTSAAEATGTALPDKTGAQYVTFFLTAFAAQPPTCPAR